MHMGAGHTLGERGGEQGHTLSISEIPTHTHTLNATSNTGGAVIAAGNLLAASPSQLYQQPDANLVAMNPAAISNVGGSQAHLNMQPFLVLNFSIALQGIFPSQT
jgi:microcystin-dependent protein